VLVPQYLGRLEFIERLDRLATEGGAEFVELALLSGRDDVVRRFERRSATSDDPAHQQAAELQRRSGGHEQLAADYERVLAVVAARPTTRVITTTDGDIAGTYAQMLTITSPEASAVNPRRTRRRSFTLGRSVTGVGTATEGLSTPLRWSTQAAPLERGPGYPGWG
jgi:hypothetical protein